MAVTSVAKRKLLAKRKMEDAEKARDARLAARGAVPPKGAETNTARRARERSETRGKAQRNVDTRKRKGDKLFNEFISEQRAPTPSTRKSKVKTFTPSNTASDRADQAARLGMGTGIGEIIREKDAQSAIAAAKKKKRKK